MRVPLQILALVLVPAGTSIAYQNKVHSLLSETAAARSVLAHDPAVLRFLALPKWENASLEYTAPIVIGALEEDTRALWTNVRHHFFNVVSGDGLNGGGAPVGHASPIWALEIDAAGNQVDIQSFSFADARDALYGSSGFRVGSVTG
jgi:hypothetical protein